MMPVPNRWVYNAGGMWPDNYLWRHRQRGTGYIRKYQGQIMRRRYPYFAPVMRGPKKNRPGRRYVLGHPSGGRIFLPPSDRTFFGIQEDPNDFHRNYQIPLNNRAKRRRYIPKMEKESESLDDW